MSLFLLIIFILFRLLKSQTTYPFESWMSDWSTANSQTKYGSSIANHTIFDIILPGAHKSGMSFDLSSNNPVTKSNEIYDDYVNVISSLNNKNQILWSARQKDSIYELLMNGIRFIDLQFEYNSVDDTYYTYNGIYGREITEIITDISRYFDDSAHSSEIVLIYLSNFIYDIDYDIELNGLFSSFSSLQSIISSSVIDINSLTIYSLLTIHNINIILFCNEFPFIETSSMIPYIYDSKNYLYIPSGDSNNNMTVSQLDEVSEVRSFISSSIKYGWPDDKLNLIYWILNIGASFGEQFQYKSFMHFSSTLNNDLNKYIREYPKLWIGNIILVDFITTTDIVSQILLLNYKYFSCRDTIWGNNLTSCSYMTSLYTEYKNDDLSPLCDIQTSLQTICPRSCGTCNILLDEGNPGDLCNDNQDCNSIIYNQDYGYNTDEGVCFIRDNDTINYIYEPSFCLSLYPQISCSNYNPGRCIINRTDDISNCNQYCSSNYQCIDGWCNIEFGVCMTLIQDTWTTTLQPNDNNKQRYWFITSDGCQQMLNEVGPFRPGDYKATPNFTSVECDSGGPSCFTDNMDANPYIASLLGFVIIPIIVTMFLCWCYCFCCWPCWCFCDRCSKRCWCCKCVLKDPSKSLSRHWTPCVLLAICCIIVIWACIEGILNNDEIHDHIFATSDSFRYAINHLFDEVISRFEAIEPTAEFIVDFASDILDDVIELLTGTGDVNSRLNDIYRGLGFIAVNYSGGINLTSTFINPFNETKTDNFTIVCDYCLTISDQAIDINQSIASSAGSALNSLQNTVNSTSALTSAKQSITNATQQFYDSLNEIINTSKTIQNVTNGFIDTGQEYDEKYRRFWVQLFFCLPFILIMWPLCGVALKNKWCFKCNWCCAMYLGACILFISWPFMFFAALWADICVRLDDFEVNFGDSQIGQLAGLDNVSENDPINTGFQLVNTCFYGESPLELFNLSNLLDWDSYRQELDETLEIDIASSLEDEGLENFQTEINGLSTDEFASEVNRIIAQANAVGGYCGCGAPNVSFTRYNLLYPSIHYCVIGETGGGMNYTNNTTTGSGGGSGPTTTITPTGIPNWFTPSQVYWAETELFDGGVCKDKFVNASAAVQVENELTLEAEMAIAGLKKDADRVFDGYDQIYGIALELEDNLQTVTCLIDPLFDQFDIILDNFTNCGFLGESYGNFKEVGCVFLFDDWYKIARALTIIGFISILIVILSMCMDYVYGPILPQEEEEIIENEDDMVKDVPHTPRDRIQSSSGNTGTGTRGIELVTVTTPNYDNAAPSAVGTYSSYVSPITVYKPPQPIGPPPGTSTIINQPAPPNDPPLTQYVPRPILAHSDVSDVQKYQINFDNEPVNKLEPIQQESSHSDDEGDIPATGNPDYEEPVVPVIILDDKSLKDSSDDTL